MSQVEKGRAPRLQADQKEHKRADEFREFFSRQARVCVRSSFGMLDVWLD